jgi:hypothetical protein
MHPVKVITAQVTDAERSPRNDAAAGTHGQAGRRESDATANGADQASAGAFRSTWRTVAATERRRAEEHHMANTTWQRDGFDLESLHHPSRAYEHLGEKSEMGTYTDDLGAALVPLNGDQNSWAH